MMVHNETSGCVRVNGKLRFYDVVFVLRDGNFNKKAIKAKEIALCWSRFIYYLSRCLLKVLNSC